jgi:hypothetical protein
MSKLPNDCICLFYFQVGWRGVATRLSAYHHLGWEFESRSWQGVLYATFDNDLQQVGGFIWVLRFPPPMKQTVTIYNCNIIEIGVNHHNPLSKSYVAPLHGKSQYIFSPNSFQNTCLFTPNYNINTNCCPVLLCIVNFIFFRHTTSDRPSR